MALKTKLGIVKDDEKYATIKGTREAGKITPTDDSIVNRKTRKLTLATARGDRTRPQEATEARRHAAASFGVLVTWEEPWNEFHSWLS